MSKPYVYLDRYRRPSLGAIGNAGGPPITRNIPTEIGSHVRAAFHYLNPNVRTRLVFDYKRTREVMS